MKPWLPLVAILLGAALLFAEEEGEKKAPVITTPKGWSTNVGEAFKKAEANPRLAVGLLFGGSDQIKLQKDVLESSVFMRTTRSRLALAYIPAPKPAAKPENGEDGKPKAAKPDPTAGVRAKYKVTSQTCVLVLLDAKGKEYGRLTRVESDYGYCGRILKTLKPVPEVIRIARSGNTKKLEAYLADLPQDVNTTDAFGNSVVMEAVKRNNLAMLKMVFSHNAKPDYRSDGGITPLMFWCKRNQTKTEIGDLLVAHGASVNAADDNLCTALYFAVQAKAAKTCEWLLKNGANPNLRDKQGITPLMLAVKAKNLPLLQMLCEQGRARIGVQDKQGNTALHFAAQSGNAEIVKYLLEHRAVKSSLNNLKKKPIDLASDGKIKAMLK